MDGLDLREQMEESAIQDAFSKLVSGKPGYKTVIEKDKPKKYCKECNHLLVNEEKFCPNCGCKVED